MSTPLLGLAVPAALLAAGLVSRGSAATAGGDERMNLGDLVDVGPTLAEVDFWLDSHGRPNRQRGVLGVKVLRKDVLLPEYLYYVMEYLADRGQWTGRRVTAAAVRAIPVSRK